MKNKTAAFSANSDRSDRSPKTFSTSRVEKVYGSRSLWSLGVIFEPVIP